jgi:DNA (cytosine-5)-methyltransferase 1
MESIRVVELFAGVGGFRIGLEGYKGKSSTSNYKTKINSKFKVIWSNQFEPMYPSKQYANDIYLKRWPNSNHSTEDIEKVIENKFDTIPDHDLLVGGFPCQDYSVASLLRKSKGLIGKKGVLWWSIYTILKRKVNKPKYLILENVPRLISSPKSNSGKDFFTILTCLNELGYSVEWRIISASDYGFPQKRKRIYLFCYHKSSILFDRLNENYEDIVFKKGILAKAFKHFSSDKKRNIFEIGNDVSKIAYEKKRNPFLNSGLLQNNTIHTFNSTPIYKGKKTVLNDILQDINVVDKSYYIDFNEKLKVPIKKIMRIGNDKILYTKGDYWRYKKGLKREWKINKTSGYKYQYDEGAMNLFDDLNSPSRTIVTNEISKTPNRSTHLIKQGNVIRNLTPIELEKLNMFPENHTYTDSIPIRKRGFLMGNALVVGLIEKIGKELQKEIFKS